MRPQDSKFEFKFVVLENGRTKKWESGGNHIFDGTKITQILRSTDVGGHIENRKTNPVIEIGSFKANESKIYFAGTNEENNLPRESSKLTYIKATDELRYH